MTDDDLTSKKESLESKGYTIDDLIEKLREVEEDGDEVIFTYTKGDQQKSLIMLRLPEKGNKDGLVVQDESDNEEYTVGRDELLSYVENPNAKSLKGTTLSIELKPGFDNPDAEPDPLGEELINKFKPIIREMMRGNYG